MRSPLTSNRLNGYLPTLLMLFFALPGYSILAQKPSKEEKKRAEEFARDLGQSQYGPETVAGQIDEQFKLHVAPGACGFFRLDLLPINTSYVPRELRTQASTMMSSQGESLIINGQNVFWYVYSEDDIGRKLTTIDVNRLFGISPLIQEEMVVTPSSIFPAWVMARNCAGYLNSSFQAGGKFPIGSADLAVKSDFQNKSTLGLIGGLFRSPISELFSKGGWRELVLNLETWNIYKNNPSLKDNAFFMNNFQGIMIARKSGNSFNFDSSAEAKAGLPLPLVNINAQIKAGINTNSSFEIKDYKTVIISDLDNLAARRVRFTRLPTAADIIDKFGRAPLDVEDVNRPLLKGRLHVHKQVIAGVPQSICSTTWEMGDVRSGVFKDGTVRVRSTYREIPSDDGKKIPACSFAIEGMPDDALFPTNANQQTQQPDAQFVGTLKSTNPLPGTIAVLTRTIEQSLPTSSQPLMRIVSAQPIDFSASNQEGTSSFKLSWRDILIDFDDNFEPVNRNPGAVALPDQGMLTCANLNTNITGEAIYVATDRKYHLTLNADGFFSHNDYDMSSSDTLRCSYEASLAVQLNRVGNPPIRRTLNLRIKVPKRKPVVQPAPSPSPIPSPSQTPTALTQPTPLPGASPSPGRNSAPRRHVLDWPRVDSHRLLDQHLHSRPQFGRWQAAQWLRISFWYC